MGRNFSIFHRSGIIGIMAYLQRAYIEAEVSLHIGYYLGFLPHLAQDKDESTPYLTHNDPFYYFFTHKSKHTRLGNFTLFSAAPLH